MSIRFGEPAGLIFMLAFGAVCAIVAQSRGRSALAWFLIGFFTWCIGLVILLQITRIGRRFSPLQSQRHQLVPSEDRYVRLVARLVSARARLAAGETNPQTVKCHQFVTWRDTCQLSRPAIMNGTEERCAATIAEYCSEPDCGEPFGCNLK